MQTYATKPGEQLIVRYARNVRITLAPATTLRITPGAFLLDGEAYFQIAAQTGQPTVVRTTHAEVRVLGTAFAVRQYRGDRASRVVVEEGKVSVRPLRSSKIHRIPTVASAGMLAQLGDSGIVVTSGIAIQPYTDWMRGRLIFDHVMLRDVITELRRAYGADIRVTDPGLASQSIGLEVSVHDAPITRVLESIGNATDSHVTRVGEAYVLVPGVLSPSVRVPRAHIIPQLEKSYGK